MDRLSRLALIWEPVHLLNRADVTLDIFRHSLSATDGLPPYTQARIIDLISNQLIRARPDACLWVTVDAPGTWYIGEIRRLVKHRIPTLILPTGQSPTSAWDFKPHAFPHHTKQPEFLWMNHRFNFHFSGLKESALRVLRIMARLKTAHTPEIASLAGFSETYVRNLLKQLQAENLIEWKLIGKYYGWEIRNKGLRLAHRSWNVPKGVRFAPYRGEYRYAGERHRRIARMWRAWLEKAYSGIEIWDCWTEVPVRYGIPDALAWGKHGDRETLFWLEVDSGHSSRRTMEANYSRRLQLVNAHAYEWRIPIVFCIMGSPWVVDAFRWSIPPISGAVAVIGHDWRDFGNLPMYQIGEWREDLKSSRYLREKKAGGELPFDPKQYPPKPRQKTPKQRKPKSTKPRYFKGSSDDDWVWKRRWSEGEE